MTPRRCCEEAVETHRSVLYLHAPVAIDPRGPAVAPGVGPGWQRLAGELAKVVPPGEVDCLWVFSAVRREEREWGTAVVSRRADADRVRVYTARFVLVTRGRDKGQGKVEINEVAECPRATIYEVLKGVQERMAEAELPVEISPSLWYAEQ